MVDLNEFRGEGFIGADPELRYTNNGTAVANASLALRRSWKKGEEWQSETHWVPLTIWGKDGEKFKERVRKGSRIICGGRLTVSNYTNRDGNKVWKTEITVDWWEVVLVEKRSDRNQGGSQNGNPEPRQGGDDDDLPF